MMQYQVKSDKMPECESGRFDHIWKIEAKTRFPADGMDVKKYKCRSCECVRTVTAFENCSIPEASYYY